MGEESSLITFEAIYEIVRKEKVNEDLQVLNQNIYNQLSNYLKTKILVYEQAEKDKINPIEIERLNLQVTNARKLIREFYERRERKLLNIALNWSRTGEKINVPGILEIEKPFVEELVSVLDKYRKEILLKLPETENYEKDSIKKENKENPNINKENKTEIPSEPKKLIRFISPVPKFLGKSLEIYGPFVEGDIANLPNEIADILIRKNKAEEIKQSQLS